MQLLAGRRRQPARRAVQARSIFIDRRQQLDNLWRAQEVGTATPRRCWLDTLLPAMDNRCCLQVKEVQQQLPEGTCSVDCITEVQDLDHLERRLDKAGSSVVCLALYSRYEHSLSHQLSTSVRHIPQLSQPHPCFVPCWQLLAWWSSCSGLCMHYFVSACFISRFAGAVELAKRCFGTSSGCVEKLASN